MHSHSCPRTYILHEARSSTCKKIGPESWNIDISEIQNDWNAQTETFFLVIVYVLVAQSCPALRDPVDCSLLGSFVHGIFQAGILEWVAISFSSGSSVPRDQTLVSRNANRFLTIWAAREAMGFPSDFLPSDLMVYPQNNDFGSTN